MKCSPIKLGGGFISIAPEHSHTACKMGIRLQVLGNYTSGLDEKAAVASSLGARHSHDKGS